MLAHEDTNVVGLAAGRLMRAQLRDTAPGALAPPRRGAERTVHRSAEPGLGTAISS